MVLRPLMVVACAAGVNARPLPARPVGALSDHFREGDETSQGLATWAFDGVLPNTTADSTGASTRLLARWACMVPSIDGTCPKVSALRGREFRFLVPPQARWLFFGNSFMGETFNALLAGVSEDLTETSQLEGKELLVHHAGEEPPPEWSKCNLRSQLVPCQPSVIAELVFTVTLGNGAVLTLVYNSNLQNEGSPSMLRQLEELLRAGRYSHTFYMPGHDAEYFAEHEAAEREHRDVDETAILGPGGVNACCRSDSTFADFAGCARARPTYKLVKDAMAMAPTLVVPWTIPPPSSFETTNTTNAYFMHEARERYTCSVGQGSSTVDAFGLGSLSNGVHQCTAVCEASDSSTDSAPARCVGGSPMVIAEELLALGVGAEERLGRWGGNRRKHYG